MPHENLRAKTRNERIVVQRGLRPQPNGIYNTESTEKTENTEKILVFKTRNSRIVVQRKQRPRRKIIRRFLRFRGF